MFVHSYYFSCILLFLYFLLAENRTNAGQLNAMRALVEAMTLHKADARVVRLAAYAFGSICGDNGV